MRHKFCSELLKFSNLELQVRFVIMGNLFCSNYTIHRRFDLKGSSHGRMTDKPIDQISEHTTLKDLDLNFIFRLEGTWFQEFCRYTSYKLFPFLPLVVQIVTSTQGCTERSLGVQVCQMKFFINMYPNYGYI